MTTNQSKKLKMLLALRVLLRANPGILAKLPNVEEFLTALDYAIVQIQTNSELQQYGTGNLTDDKNKLRLALIADTVDVSRKMQAYAAYIKDSALQKDTKYVESDLTRLLDVELVTVSKGLYGKVNGNLPKLSSYVLTDATQTAFLADITAYETAIPQTEKSKLDQKNITALIAQNFDAADEALKNIDLLVEIIHTTEPQFYADYKALHKVDNPYTSVQVQAKVTDADTKAPIVNATATFRLSGNPEPVLVKQTAEKGGFFIKNLAEGIYTVTISKLGYQTQTITVTVTSDAICNINVQLVKA
jgi:hypothetical protein